MSNVSLHRTILITVMVAVVGRWAWAVDVVPSVPVSADSMRGAKVYNLWDFGAKGDGKTLDTGAIQAAIDACHGEGGGTVLVPAGDFLTGTIQLKSNVNLHLLPTGRLLGSSKPEDYTAGEGVPRGNGNIVLLYAVEAENVSITGQGTIDGQGANFYTGQGDGSGPGDNRSTANVARPHLCIFYRCKNLTIRDAFFTRSAYHCFRILQCQHVHIDGVRIYNRVNKNNDGFHFNSSEYVTVSNCNVICQDDGCALFGSNKFVTVTNCTFSTRWSIFRFGGGETQNIAVSNCIIYETYGCPIKISAGGRTRIENLSFANLIMKDVTGPISVGYGGGRRRSGNDDASDERGYVRNLSFSNIRASVVDEPHQHADMPFPPKIYDGEQMSCITLNGTGDNVIENVRFSNVQVTYAGGGTAELAAKRDVPEIVREYFGVWGTPPLGPPAYGMYARGVKGLTLDNVRFEVESPDLRPAVIFDHVADAAVNNLNVEGTPEAESLLRFIDSRDVLLTAPRILSPTDVFLRLEGAANENIILDGGDLSKAKTVFSLHNDATEKAITVRD